MKAHYTRISWPLLLALMFAGCGSHHGTSEAVSPNTPVELEVENHNWSDIVIYLVRGSQRQRLGMVTALGNTVFTFPYRRLGNSGDARLSAHAIGGSGYTSESVLVQPGQTLKWTLESDLARSSLAVY
ncbi:MAG TPA: hypothetical protein VHR41_13235 [Gemmatimonadales bacterium]|jgi:hypothetical protein|nr:hypothetical protein [Gemmatimonadales bacterium]